MLLRRMHEYLLQAEGVGHRVAEEDPRLTFLIGSKDFSGSPSKTLERSQRFVFSESAFAACQQIADHPRQLIDARTQIFAPFPHTWMEFPASDQSIPMAFQWIEHEDNCLRKGTVAFITWPKETNYPVLIPADLDLDSENPLTIASSVARQADGFLSALRELGDTEPGPIISSRSMREQLPKILNWVLAGWALLATKGMTEAIKPDYSKLNKARQRRGLYPLLAYTEIRLNLDVERAVKAKSIIGTGHMPLHPVRAHLRLLPTGKVTIVKAHMRGNPEYGVRSHHYSVVRAEDPQ